MKDDFEVFDPQKFFETFVLRAYNEHLQNPLDHYHVKTAVHNANVLAERVWQSSAGKFDRAHTYRTHLVQNECPDFQLVWDIDDGHKHVQLDRRSRRVTSAAQTGIERSGGTFGSMAFSEAPFGGATDSFVVRLDDGTRRSLTDILKNVVEM